MWLKSFNTLLFAGIVLSGGLTFAATDETADPPSATGPRSQSEADVLWETGEGHFQSGDFNEAASVFQRLADRYPAFKNMPLVHGRLGQAYLEIKKPKLALKAFKAQLARSKDPIVQIPIRLKIGESHLLARNFHEALLMSAEILKRKPRPPTPFEFTVYAKMLSARALRGLNRLSEASLRTDEIRQDMIANSGFQNLENPVRVLEVSMKFSRCANLAPGKKMEETQALQEIDRRGECVVGALDHSKGLSFKPETPETEWLAMVQEGRNAVLDYGRVCRTPPEPVGKRSRKQIEQYMKEMREAVAKTCDLWAKGMRRSLSTLPYKPWSEILLAVDEAFPPIPESK